MRPLVAHAAAALVLTAVAGAGAPAGAQGSSYAPSSAQGCSSQTWTGTLHYRVVDGALVDRVLDCRSAAGSRRVDALLDNDAYVARLFDTMIAIAPPALLAQIDELVLTASHPHSAGGIEGYVSPSVEDVARFNFGVSLGRHVRPSDWTDEDILHIIVHEFAHILSLDADELVPLPAGGRCEAHQPWPTHCARPGALIERYRQRFWAAGAARASVDAAFVSPYAQTNVEEDFAETFASWVLRPHMLAPGTILGEKASFLAKEPELLSVRDHMRARLGLPPVAPE